MERGQVGGLVLAPTCQGQGWRGVDLISFEIVLACLFDFTQQVGLVLTLLDQFNENPRLTQMRLESPKQIGFQVLNGESDDL